MDSNYNDQQHQVGINSIVSSMLAKQTIDPAELKQMHIELANTNELIDIMIGLVSKGKENLTEEENKIRILISDELKSRALVDQM